MSASRLAGRILVVLLAVAGSARALLPVLGAPTPTEANKDLVVGQDFRDATYYPVRELLAGGDPYLPSNMFAGWPVRQEFGAYAPSHLTLHAPFGLLDYRTSLLVFSVVAIGCVFAIGLVCARTYRLPGGWWSAWLVGALLVISQPGKSAVFIGQINPVVALGGTLALSQARRRPAWAAIGLALAWTKPQFGLPLLVLLVARGAWREGLGGTLLAFVVSLPSLLLILSREGVATFVDVMRTNVEYSSSVARTAVDSEVGARVDTAAVLFRLTGWIPPAAEIIVLVVVLGAASFVLRRTGRGRPLDADGLLIASTACLTCVVHQQGESLLTVAGLVCVASAWARHRNVAPVTAVAAVMLTIPLLRFGFVSVALESLTSRWFDMILEGLILNVAFWLLVVTHARRSRARQPDPAANA